MPEFRVVEVIEKGKNVYYYPQVKRWWWPFWMNVYNWLNPYARPIDGYFKKWASCPQEAWDMIEKYKREMVPSVKNIQYSRPSKERRSTHGE